MKNQFQNLTIISTNISFRVLPILYVRSKKFRFRVEALDIKNKILLYYIIVMDDNTVDTLGNDPIHKSFDKFYRYFSDKYRYSW